MTEEHLYLSTALSDCQATRGQVCRTSRGREEHASSTSVSGLSKLHILPHIASMKLWLTGRLIKVTKSGVCMGVVSSCRRGKVKAFGKNHRRRLLYKLGMIDKSIVPDFVSLTYPGRYEGDVESAKRDLNVLNKRMTRLGAAAIWRLEWKVRQSGESVGLSVPHFHMFVWRPAGWTRKDYMRWVTQAWYEVVGSCQADHLKAGTRVEYMRSWHGVSCYAAKYIGKVDESAVPENCGRQWGVINRKLIPWSEMVHQSITDQECDKAFKLFEEIVGKKIWYESSPSRTLLFDNPSCLREMILLRELRV